MLSRSEAKREHVQSQHAYVAVRRKHATRASIVVEPGARQHAEITQRHLFDVLEHARLRGVLERAIGDHDVLDLGVFQADEVERPAALVRRHVFDVNIADLRIELAFAAFVKQVDPDDGLLHLPHAHVPHVQVFQIAATQGVGF